MKLLPVFLTWSAVMIALWLIMAIGQAFVDIGPIEWLIWVPPACALIHALAVVRDRN